jgi:hypothetical protein
MAMWLNNFSLKRSDDYNYAQNDRPILRLFLLGHHQRVRLPRRCFTGKPD